MFRFLYSVIITAYGYLFFSFIAFSDQSQYYLYELLVFSFLFLLYGLHWISGPLAFFLCLPRVWLRFFFPISSPFAFSVWIMHVSLLPPLPPIRRALGTILYSFALNFRSTSWILELGSEERIISRSAEIGEKVKSGSVWLRNLGKGQVGFLGVGLAQEERVRSWQFEIG